MDSSEIKKIVLGSINTLLKKNKKIITNLENLIEKNDGLTKTQLHEFLEGMYQALLDYSKKNNSTVNATLKKDKSFVAESLKDYSTLNKSAFWKLGYAIIQYEIANKSSKRLKLYASLYMSSKSSRKSNKTNWNLSTDEKEFFLYFTIGVDKVAERISDTDNNKDSRDNVEVSKPKKEKKSTSIRDRKREELRNDDKNSGSHVSRKDVMLNPAIPRNSFEFIWPFGYNRSPKNIDELKKLIEFSGYEDEDLEKKYYAVFTTDNKYALALSPKGNKGYLYLLKKNEHYWDPLLINNSVLLLEYNFTRTFNENVQCLLRNAENIFPIRVKN